MPAMLHRKVEPAIPTVFLFDNQCLNVEAWVEIIIYCRWPQSPSSAIQQDSLFVFELA